jgi:hypothetical protein
MCFFFKRLLQNNEISKKSLASSTYVNHHSGLCYAFNTYITSPG